MSMEWLTSSCILILLVLVIRTVFRRKIRARLRYGLWLLVALRLLFPFTVSRTTVSVLNFLPEQMMAGAENEDAGASGGSEGAAEKETMDDESANRDSVNQAATYDMRPEGGLPAGLATEKKSDGFPANPLLADLSAEVSREFPDKSPGPDLRRTLLYIWILGVILGGSALLAVNMVYGFRLRQSRERISPEKLPYPFGIPVYTAQVAGAPCLSGLFRPAVYVTPEVAGEERDFAFVLRHENVHYMHRDNWWALVRVLCLCLHWYNPLVWLAAQLSRQDGELACDEKALEELGAKARVEYGRTLLKLSSGEGTSVSAWQISTAMGGGGRQLRERLQMIVNAPAKGRIAQMLLAVLAVSVLVFTFTGRSISSETGEALREMESAVAEKSQEITERADFSEEGQEAANGKLSGREPAAEGGQFPTGIPKDGQSEENAPLLSQRRNTRTDEVVSFENVILTEEMENAYRQIQERESPYPQQSDMRAEDVLALDLNFDGWNDLCIRGRARDAVNIPWYCMLWDQQRRRYEYAVTLCNVETDTENELIISRIKGTAGEEFTIWHRFDGEGSLHMVRYVEERAFGDGTGERLDLTYVEDEESIYILPAIVDESHLNLTMIEMARQALSELYQWTGERVDTACFQVTNMGSVFFSITPEDMKHSRTFLSRSFGADTEYNLSGYDRSISSLGVASERLVWFSPVHWRVFPEQMDTMTDEEVIAWYFERLPMKEADSVKNMLKRYEDIWTVEAESGSWFEVFYDVKLREVLDITGPYPECPQH